jgi:hypothetical protein
MTEQESQEHLAQRAADKAVDRVFSLLFGVDLDDQEHINEFRADLGHMRRLRKLSEKVGTTSLIVFVSALATGVISVLWKGLSKIFGGHTG